jgi:hypothetical protein
MRRRFLVLYFMVLSASKTMSLRCWGECWVMKWKKWSRHSRGRVEGIQEKNINRESRFRRRHLVFVGRDSSVGIATRYGLDGTGIESRWRRDFPQPSIPSLGLTQPPIQWVSGLFPVVKRPELRVDHPPPSSTEVKERVELYLYSPSGSSWPVM